MTFRGKQRLLELECHVPIGQGLSRARACKVLSWTKIFIRTIPLAR